MKDAVEYARRNDPKKPNFAMDCVADGTVRASSLEPDAEEMSKREKDFIENK